MTASDLHRTNLPSSKSTVQFRRRPWRPALVAALAMMFVRFLNAQTPAPTQAPTQTQTPSPAATSTSKEATGKTEGNYAVQQSIEFGYRDSMIGGNLNNYDTFENLSSGLRLFDYTVDMHSVNHQGLFFDDLSS